MKRKLLVFVAALVLAPAAAWAMDCCKDCPCCKDKAAAEAHAH